MISLRRFLALSTLSALVSSVAGVAQQPAPLAVTVPPAIAAARTIFVSNAGADAGLFPEPFSGTPERGYEQFYAALHKSGQFELVNDPSQADLVLELRLTAPYGPSNANKQNGTADPRPEFRLTVYDRKSHYVLWTVTDSVEFAILQRTHDRNFDDAVNRVVFAFLHLAGKPVVTASTAP